MESRARNADAENSALHQELQACSMEVTRLQEQAVLQQQTTDGLVQKIEMGEATAIALRSANVQLSAQLENSRYVLVTACSPVVLLGQGSISSLMLEA